MVPVSIFFPKNSYLTEVFSRKLEEFEAAGLISYWSSAHMDTKYLNFNSGNVEPKKINLNHVMGTVQLLIGGLICSAAAFIGEFFVFKMRHMNYVKRLLRFTSSNYK